ncbi:MAG: Do family serine endopeptidase [Candidatus Hydrogenedentes bacterium]|nr:Do family serine endopeptidase [Candidatus Hydrogenedentota bacterium]
MKTITRVFLVAALAVAGLALPARAITPLLREFEDAFVKLSDQVLPAVVSIEIQGKKDDMGPQDPDDYNDLFKFFGIPGPGPNNPHGRTPRKQTAVGSGFIYSKEGMIITNNHVVENADTIEVTLHDNSKFEATVVGRDPDTDIAVIKIDPKKDLPVVVFGDSDSVKVGQFAVAMGSPRGFEGSVSFGHISALGRNEVDLPRIRFRNFIQTDAAINLGNSGGPLVNIEGQVIGINTAIVWGAQSLGFAIPVNKVKEVLPELIAKGHIVRGFLGVQVQPVNRNLKDALSLPDDVGAYVVSVVENTPAQKAGILYDDIIRKVNGEPIKGPDELVRRISEVQPGATAKLEVWRKGQIISVDVKVEEYKPEEAREGAKAKSSLGVKIQGLTPELAERLGVEPGTKGVVVMDIAPDSPAADSDIQRGDIITEIAQQPVNGVTEFRDLIAQKAQPGKTILLRVIRGGERPMPVVIKIPADYKPN